MRITTRGITAPGVTTFFITWIAAVALGICGGCHWQSAPQEPTAAAPVASPSTPATPAVALPAIDAVQWRCVKFVDAQGKTLAAGAKPPTIRFGADGRAAGFAGVNRYFATVELGSGRPEMTLRFGAAGATRMAGPEDLMDLEQAYLSMLEQVRFARVVAGPDGPELILKSEKGDCAWFVPGPKGDDTGGK